MITIKSFIFNSFEENTYVLSDSTGECVIIDPGCHLKEEEEELARYITGNALRPVLLLNTHCHIDHVLGNRFVADRFGLKLFIHATEQQVLDSSSAVSMMYGIQMSPSPAPEAYLAEGDTVTFGNSSLKVIFTPGHSPGSISFYNEAQRFLISGDVLFRMSIGRTDLPGGNFETLIKSITTGLMPLGDEVTVYSGHGEPTTLGFEKQYNPFLTQTV
ncbi:MAG TPA: MBL fold metallo-hydrolase [Bacteroidia bacterium]|nr:MBL fold metallo-hydrolase [Bacteroidia bacterium]